MDLYQHFIFLSRYARWLDSAKRRETWPETIGRYFDFFESHLKENFNHQMDRAELESAVLNMEYMPSMRALMTAGAALKRENLCQYNCSYIAIDRATAFDEILYILINGVGVGFSVERQYIAKLPEVADSFHDSDTVISVADSKIGWAKALKELVHLLYGGQIPKWDLSKVRPAGARLKTFGGRASGPGPLEDLFRFVVRTFKAAAGRKLTSVECHDIVCKIADSIVAGGVRRSALISLSNLSDDRMRNAKSGQWWEINPQRRLANNSAVYTEKPDIGIYMEEWLSLYRSKSGERGIFNRQAAGKQAAKNSRREEYSEFGTNPCLTANTMVAVADGRIAVPIGQLAKEGVDVPVYTLDNNGNVGIRYMRNPRITGYSMPVYDIELDDGSKITATENHKFLLKNGEYKELKDLKPGDSLLVDSNIHSTNASIKNKKTDRCEKCNNNIDIVSPEVMFCSETCHNDYMNELHESIRSSVSSKEYQYSTVLLTKFAGVEDVYNGTVEEYHNFFINVGSTYYNTLNCGEIILRNNELCNLSEAVVRSGDDLETLKRKVRLAAIIGTYQSTLTDFRYLNKRWQNNCNDERLLGVSLTGVMDHEVLSGSAGMELLASWLDALRETAVAANAEFADKLGIPRSAAITCMKPSGTVSQLVDAASGIHPRHSRYYIRTVRADKKDPLAKLMQDMGFPAETDVLNEHNVVFSFPIESPETALLRTDLSAIEHLEIWKIYKNHWCEHNPSITITVKEHEWVKVGAWVYDNFDDIVGVSFLPHSDHTYQQAPYQEVDHERYAMLLKQMPTAVDWGRLSDYEAEDNTAGPQTLSCTAGACEIVDLTA